MKKIMIFVVIGLFTIISFNCSGGGKYPIVYYYEYNNENNDGSVVTYTLNADETATITTEWNGTTDVFQTSWKTIGSNIWIKPRGSEYSEIIKEGILYKDSEAADAKRNGQPLIRK